MILALLGLTIGRPATAQQEPTEFPSFDVATVKPSSHPLTPEGYSFSDQRVVSPGRFRAVNSNLDELIRWAYDLEEYQISEPDWLKSNSVTFDILAGAGSDTTAMQIRLMVRRLLHERFDVELHRERRTMAAYDLVLSKGGLNLQRAPVQTPKMINFGQGHLKTAGTSMSRLAAGLSRELHRPVIDMTGLPNMYVIDLQYAPPDGVETDSDSSLFTALREAGLLLKPVKTSIEIIKVDRANASPTPN
ncbi:MAG TPA: TIGR03435 family protein [Bryobacteraceae bacterium]|nr:TIGR03435 family protein [Bryobacteraceae bacterium]